MCRLLVKQHYGCGHTVNIEERCPKAKTSGQWCSDSTEEMLARKCACPICQKVYRMRAKERKTAKSLSAEKKQAMVIEVKEVEVEKVATELELDDRPPMTRQYWNTVMGNQEVEVRRPRRGVAELEADNEFPMAD